MPIMDQALKQVERACLNSSLYNFDAICAMKNRSQSLLVFQLEVGRGGEHLAE
jgi:hypothetical protein